MEKRTVVLGVGNTLLSDEGIGVHALAALRGLTDGDASVELIDGGTLSFTLAGSLAEADQLIVIDAAELNDAPGAVAVYENEAMDRHLGQGKRRSVHEVSLLDLLAIAQLTDSLPARRALIGIQPQELSWGERPSPAVAAALPTVCALALDLIRKWQA